MHIFLVAHGQVEKWCELVFGSFYKIMYYVMLEYKRPFFIYTPNPLGLPWYCLKTLPNPSKPSSFYSMVTQHNIQIWDYDLIRYEFIRIKYSKNRAKTLTVTEREKGNNCPKLSKECIRIHSKINTFLKDIFHIWKGRNMSVLNK